eukprot:jgi/Orpsp1_1/1188884/evm.model.d7180000067947.1
MENGIHLFKNDNTEIAIGGDGNGYLYECTSHVCVQKFGLGYFVSGKTPYTAKDGLFTKATLESATLKYYLTKENELVKCTSNNAASCSTVTITAGYYPNAAAKTADSFDDAIIKCDDSKCELKTAVDGEYYLNQGADKDNDTEESKLPLIKCATSGKCVTAASTAIGHLIDSGDNTKIISCSSLYACTSNSIVEGAYLSVTAGEVISCVKGEGDVVTCSASSGHGGTDTSPVYYLEANSDATKRKIYRCDNSNCAKVTQPVNGIYLNKADANNESYISCDGNVCEIKKALTTCSKAADVIIVGSDLKICTDDDDSNATDVLLSDTGTRTSNKYYTLNLASASDIKNNSKTK